MKTPITKYVADDGSEWTAVEKAQERDTLLADVARAMKPLGERPDNCGFSSGGGFIQHQTAVVRQVRLALHEVAKGPLGWWFKRQREDHGKTDEQIAMCHPSWPGRMLDGGCAPLENAYGRLCCIDDLGREWGQPYYATHPDEAKQVCVGST